MDDLAYFKYWGKAKKHSDSGAISYHLLAYHSLDVACVGYHMLAPEKSLCQNLAQALNVQPPWLRDWFVFCLMLHDLGKFCRSFQNLVPNISQNLVPFVNCDDTTRHDSLGFVLWKDILANRLTDLIPAIFHQKIVPWLEIVCGHHGQPPQKACAINQAMLPEDEQAAEQFVRTIAKQWLPKLEPLNNYDKYALRSVSWHLAGITVLADWLGSNQHIFDYCAKPQPLADYWQNTALSKAHKALEHAAINPKVINPFTSLTQQFPFIVQATPLQTFAEHVEIDHGPQLFILEDVTGAGKTEAAMVLAHRLMHSGLANSLYVGLPTMATANAMYERMGLSYRALFSQEQKPSLVLSHGARDLSSSFKQSVELSEQHSDIDYADDDQTASAYCNQWLADSRKKSLLADVGVGTIDQALLAILPAKHQSLRLFGLHNTLLLVDEVHAYDAYMHELLCLLLKAHAGQGGSAILLSATLPKKMRIALTKAYAEGADFKPPTLHKFDQYPLATQVSQQDCQEYPLNTRASVARSVAVKRLDSQAAAIETIQAIAATGQCVCWIRNTVSDAINAYQQLLESGVIPKGKLTLFHSRFAMLDRQAIEETVLTRFGKNSTADMRAGQVLIATQVIEQSLDIDLDAMITDLAPIELVMQRSGRLQRHQRNHKGEISQDGEQRNKPCLYLLAPDPAQVNDQHWLRSLLPGTQAVYPHIGQLWLALATLMKKEGFTLPDDARHLIESVYGEADYPDVLEQDSINAEGDKSVMRSMGRFNGLKLEKGYTRSAAEHNSGWSNDVHIPTRLDADTISVALVNTVNGALQAYADVQEHPWALSEIKLPIHEWEDAAKTITPQMQKKIEDLKEQEPALRWLEVWPLGQEPRYSADLGWGIPRAHGERA